MSFGGDLQKFEVNAIKSTDKTIRGTAIALFRAIIIASPVDTGRFRGNWFASGIEPSTRVDNGALDPTGASAVTEAANKVLSLKSSALLNLTNNLPYARRLNEGWSKQAPLNFVGKNAARFQAILDREARKNNK